MKRIVGYIGLLSMLLLSACGGQDPEVKVYDHLESAVELEATYVEQQEVIMVLEEQEKEKYDQITDLNVDDMDEINKLSEEALELIEERSEEVDLEKESLEASREEFEKITKNLENIEDDALRTKGEELYDVMIKRYESYDKIYKAYKTSLEDDAQMYEMFQDEDLTQEDYVAQTAKVNDNYQVILEENKTFNDYTQQYNELKQEFYELANLNVETETNEADANEEKETDENVNEEEQEVNNS